MKHKPFDDNSCKPMPDCVREALSVPDRDVITVGTIELGLCIQDDESTGNEAVWSVNLKIDQQEGCITVDSAFQVRTSTFTTATNTLLRAMLNRQPALEMPETKGTK